jgi:hypothetical protein
MYGLKPLPFNAAIFKAVGHGRVFHPKTMKMGSVLTSLRDWGLVECTIPGLRYASPWAIFLRSLRELYGSNEQASRLATASFLGSRTCKGVPPETMKMGREPIPFGG